MPPKNYSTQSNSFFKDEQLQEIREALSKAQIALKHLREKSPRHSDSWDRVQEIMIIIEETLKTKTVPNAQEKIETNMGFLSKECSDLKNDDLDMLHELNRAYQNLGIKKPTDDEVMEALRQVNQKL